MSEIRRLETLTRYYTGTINGITILRYYINKNIRVIIIDNFNHEDPKEDHENTLELVSDHRWSIKDYQTK